MNLEIDETSETFDAPSIDETNENSDLENISSFEEEGKLVEKGISEDTDESFNNFQNYVKSNESGINEKNHEANSSFKDSDGIKNFTDDNGQIYRKGNELLADAKYEINGYKYETDNQGRIVSAEGYLQTKDHENRNTMDTKKYMDMDYEDTDDRGHLIADRFNGSGRVDNVVPMDSDLNRKEYKNLEDYLSKYVNDPEESHDVYVLIEAVYDDDSDRPTSFIYMYQIDGEVDYQEFSNTKKN